MKSEIEKAGDEVGKLRQDLLEKEQQNAVLKKANAELSKKLKSYRTMLAESQKNEEMLTKKLGDATKLIGSLPASSIASDERHELVDELLAN